MPKMFDYTPGQAPVVPAPPPPLNLSGLSAPNQIAAITAAFNALRATVQAMYDLMVTYEQARPQ